jgi:hypothetical protein
MLAMGDAVALTMVTKTASEAHGHLAISVVGLTWAPPRATAIHTPEFQIILPSDQAHQFQHLTASSD